MSRSIQTNNKSNRRNTKKFSKNGNKHKQSTYTTRIPKMFGFIKPRELSTLRYTDILTYTTAAATGNQYIFRLNSIFDPDVTGGGHQCYGHDTLATLYNRYRVTTCHWKIIIPQQQVTMPVTLVPTNGQIPVNVTTLATYTASMELPYAHSLTLSYGSGPTVHFTGSIFLPQLNGSTAAEYESDDRFSAIFGANPTEVLYLYLTLYNLTAGSITIYPTIQLWYDVDVYDPILQPQS